MSHCVFLVLSEVVHVDVSVGVHPVFVGFDGEGAHEAQAALGVWKDAHDLGAAADFLVEALVSLHLELRISDFGGVFT